MVTGVLGGSPAHKLVTAINVPGSVRTGLLTSAAVGFNDVIVYPAPTTPPETVNVTITPPHPAVVDAGVTVNGDGPNIVIVADVAPPTESDTLSVTGPEGAPNGTVTVMVVGSIVPFHTPSPGAVSNALFGSDEVIMYGGVPPEIVKLTVDTPRVESTVIEGGTIRRGVVVIGTPVMFTTVAPETPPTVAVTAATASTIVIGAV
jgi:hypothetical protein